MNDGSYPGGCPFGVSKTGPQRGSEKKFGEVNLVTLYAMTISELGGRFAT